MPRHAISIKDAMAYCKARMGNEGVKEFSYRTTMDGHEVLVLGISHEQHYPDFVNPPRQFRVETFVDGKHKTGLIVSS